jgi:CheY-like chemotaxis protein
MQLVDLANSGNRGGIMTERMVSERTRRPTGKTIKVRTLIVDPNPTTRVHVKDALRGLEIIESVAEKSSFNGLVEFLKETPVNVALFDSNLQDQDIFEIVGELKKHPIGAKIKYVLIGTEFDEAAKARGAELGINGYVVKPIDMRSIEMAVMDAIRPPDSSVSKAIPDALRQILNKFRQVSLFFGFSDVELIRMLKICKSRRIPSGSFLFKEGDKGDSLFVVIAGQIDITKSQNGTSQVLVSMEAGDCFGEMAIIDSEPRMADAVAASDATVLEINQSVINENEDITSLKLVRQLAILLVRKLRASSG